MDAIFADVRFLFSVGMFLGTADPLVSMNSFVEGA
jgi:hypothetical protein